MNSVIEALEQIETLLLQQQAQINQLRTDLNSLIKLVQVVTEAATYNQPAESESQL